MSDSFDSIIWGIPLYIGFLYVLFSRLTRSPQTNLMVAVAVYATQFLFSSYFDFQGYTGWLLFAFLIGRVLGIYHPVTFINEPLNLTRKILGWLALVVFVLCFSPEPFVV
ncbi:MAG: hypothetical protein ACFB15_07020 [Cyclobacteriaceae bacterium]